MNPKIPADSMGGKDERTHGIIGSAMEVHRQLGAGFLEAVYHEALAIEFIARDIPFQREIDLPVRYKGQALACGYRPDFLCYECVIVEIKAQSTIGSADHAQVINYLKASGHEIGLLLNFGAPSLDFKRLCLTQEYLRKSAKSADNQLSLARGLRHEPRPIKYLRPHRGRRGRSADE